MRDARRIQAQLCDPLRCGYRTENVKMLLGPEATRANVEKELGWLIERHLTDPLATVIFYYSGHGMAEPATLLLNGCFDEGDPRPESVAAEGLPGHLLCEYLAGIDSNKLLVVLDCCQAAAQVANFKGVGLEQGFSETADLRNRTGGSGLLRRGRKGRDQ